SIARARSCRDARAGCTKPTDRTRQRRAKPTMTGDVLREPQRETPIFGEYEVVVLGGGPAGIAAALAAGRAGRSTILIERYGFLGGAGTAAGLSTFCGLHAVVHGRHEQRSEERRVGKEGQSDAA